MNGNTNETGNHLFLFAPTTFVGFSLARLWRLIVWFSAHMDRWFFTCLHIKHSLWFSFKVFCQHFLAPIDNWLLLSVFHIMRDPKQTNIFKAKCSCNILLMFVILLSKDSSISRYVVWRSCLISYRTIPIFSGTITDFGRTARNSSWIKHRPR